MPQVEITQVASKAERDAFIKFPWRIYQGDPAWVPPLLLERKEFLDQKKHPFFEHGAAALFLARSGGKIVGRIMASDDPNYNAFHQSNVGCFGLFECVNDPAVAAALFEAATNWLRARGRDEIMGPIDYSTNYVCGLLVEGFDFPPTLLTAHNPPYYPALIEGFGFNKVIDFYAWWFSEPARAATRLRRLAASLRKRDSATIRQGNLKNFSAEAGRLREIYNDAWKENVVPEFTLIAEVGDEPVGFILCVPDINVAFRKINGRLTSYGFPIGLAKLLYHKSRIRTARLIALGVKPKYRRGGIAEMLVLRIIEDAMIKRGFTGELSMTLENNHLINRFLAAIGAKKYKTYRIYRKQISRRVT